MFNYPEVEVPITDSQTNKTIILLGTIVTSLGAHVVYTTMKKNNA